MRAHTAMPCREQAAVKATAKRLTTRLVAGPDAGKTVRINPFAVMVERAGGVKVLSVLQFHPNEEIHTKAVRA